MDIIQETKPKKEKIRFSALPTERLTTRHLSTGYTSKITNRLSWKAYGKMTN